MLVYLDTNSGIAGDMTLAALVDAGADAQYIQHQVDSLGLGQVALVFSDVERHCFRALMLDVRHPPEHAHRHLSDIEAMIVQSSLTSRERDMAIRIFRKLGAAEAKVHGTTIEQVHFHEVGAVDSIVDIVGVSVALCNLEASRIVASPTPTGTGTIHIAHGVVSVPAPATAELLRGVPIRSSQIEAELTTPTGAAILATLVDHFGPLPDMQISRIGYGAGHKNLVEQANLLRILIGEPLRDEADEVVVLETNLDDVTGEQLGFSMEQIWKAGALDVFTTAIGMKKSRPATLLSVICRPGLRTKIEDCIFQHSGSLGIRRSRMPRRKLHREIIRVTTAFGDASVKIAWSHSGPRFSPEYEDCRRLALEHGQSLDAVFRTVLDAAEDAAKNLTPPNVISDQVESFSSLGDHHSHSVGDAPESQDAGHSSDHDHDHPHDHHHH